MNYRDKIRKAIECPQFGYDHYGEWGALRLDQRRYIKRLLDELDGADAYILQLYEENQQLKEKLEDSERARNNCFKYLKNPPEDVWSGHSIEKAIELLDIDKGAINNEIV